MEEFVPGFVLVSDEKDNKEVVYIGSQQEMDNLDLKLKGEKAMWEATNQKFGRAAMTFQIPASDKLAELASGKVVMNDNPPCEEYKDYDYSFNLNVIKTAEVSFYNEETHGKWVPEEERDDFVKGDRVIVFETKKIHLYVCMGTVVEFLVSEETRVKKSKEIDEEISSRIFDSDDWNGELDEDEYLQQLDWRLESIFDGGTVTELAEAQKRIGEILTNHCYDTSDELNKPKP